MLGLPLIACDVGGVSSVIEHEVSGMLVPSNGVFELVAAIKDYAQARDRYCKIANIGRELAQKRHDREKIVNELITAYTHMISLC